MSGIEEALEGGGVEDARAETAGGRGRKGGRERSAHPVALAQPAE